MALSYEDFQRGVQSGQYRLIGDENGNGTWYQIVPSPFPGMDPGLQAMPGFVPPTKPVAPTFDNLGAGLNTPLTSGGQQVYAVNIPSADGNPANTQQTYYLANDPNRPADATPAFAGGYSTDNGGGFLDKVLSSVLDPVGNAAGAVLNPVGDKVLTPFFENGNMGKLVLGGAAALTGAGGAGLIGAPAAPETAALYSGLTPEALSTASLAPEAAGAGATAALPEAANVAGGLTVAPQVAGGLDTAISGASAAGGASGITPGLATETAAGLGGGLVSPGIAGATGVGTTGAIGAAGAGLGAGLAEGAGTAAAGGTGSVVVPAAAGAAGSAIGNAAGTAAGTAAGNIGGTKLGDILSGNVNPTDILKNLSISDLSKALGTLGLTVGSVAGNQAQSDALKSLSDQYMALGAPSRSRYEASFAPGFDITTADPAVKTAMDASYNSLLRGLSTNGNPFGNPGGLAEAMKYVTGNIALPATQNYRNQNAATSGIGAFSSAAPGAAIGSINATGNSYADIGRGLANLLSPPTSLDQLLKSIKGTGVSMSLT